MCHNFSNLNPVRGASENYIIVLQKGWDPRPTYFRKNGRCISFSKVQHAQNSPPPPPPELDHFNIGERYALNLIKGYIQASSTNIHMKPKVGSMKIYI